MHPTITKKLRYKLDNIFSKGVIALIGMLALISAGIVIVLSLLVWGIDITTESNLIDQFWKYSMIVLKGDPTGGAPWPYRLITQLVVLTGLFITSMLIGILAASVKNKFEELNKGRSEVIESNHTVILGWSDQVLTIIAELVIANENQPKSCIVILGNKDKTEMETEIRTKVPNTGKTKIVCRMGNPIDVDDLRLVSLATSKSIIIVTPKDVDADTRTIKTLLAITNDSKRRENPYNIVAQINHRKNLEVADIIGKDEVELVHSNDMIAKIAVQTCRQPGLSVVYTDLLDFDGDEIYFKAEPTLSGKSFSETVLAYDDSSVVGIFRDGKPILNPSMDTTIKVEDQIITISKDDNTVILSKKENYDIDNNLILPGEKIVYNKVNALILGWNKSADYIIGELDNYAETGLVVLVAGEDTEIKKRMDIGETSMKNQIVKYHACDITDRESLDKLDLGEFNHIILLSCSDLYDREEADAHTLVTLIHVRDIARKGEYSFSIVSEFLDGRNRDLVSSKRASDFVVSERLVSLTLSQISERNELGAVFRELFKASGSEVYFKPASNYVKIENELNFYTVLQSSIQKNEIAIGYRIHSLFDNADNNYGIVLNPNKSDTITLNENDSIIVLAEN
jgi:K+/H+ antiporter YhaU regulatory subunit KhtT